MVYREILKGCCVTFVRGTCVENGNEEVDSIVMCNTLRFNRSQPLSRLRLCEISPKCQMSIYESMGCVGHLRKLGTCSAFSLKAHFA